MRLRYIFIGLFCIVALMPVAIFWAWPHSKALQNEIDGAEHRHLLLARNVSSALSRYQNDVVSVFKLITSNLIKDVPITSYEEILSGMSFRHICVFSYPHGALIRQASKSQMPCPETLPEKRRAQFASLQLSEKPQFTQVTKGPDGKPVLLVVKKTGPYLAVGAIATDYFVNLAKSIAFGEQGHAAIVDHAGNVLAHPLQAWVDAGRDISQISAVQSMLRGETGVAVFFSPALNAQMIAGYTSVPEVNWGVMVPQPLSELKQEVTAIKNLAIWVVACGAVIAAFIAWLVSIHLSRPLERFTKAAQRVGAGDLSPDFGIGHQLVVPKEVKAAQVALHDMAIQLRESAQAMNRLAFIDNLTSLPNRQRFRSLAHDAVKEANEHKEPVTLLFCDLNGFKSINDTYGHRAGDEILKIFASRLDRCVARHEPWSLTKARHRQFVSGRLGGDEFAVFFRGLEPAQVVSIAHSILHDIERPFELYHNEILTISASIGLAGSPEQGTDLNQLLRCADAAMYYAKRRASPNIAIYDANSMQSPRRNANSLPDSYLSARTG